MPSEEKSGVKTLDEKEIINYSWAIRPCFLYKEEYKDCTSIKARFHQYFIHGETIDCNQWKRDYDNCIRYEERKDLKAASELIASEENRRTNRMRAHYGNDVWRKREGPPKDWNKPLPEWLQKKQENTYLGIKAREMNGENVKYMETDSSFCSIM